MLSIFIGEKIQFQGGLEAIISIGVIHAIILITSIVSIASFGVYHVGMTKIWNRTVAGGRIIPPEYIFLSNKIFRIFSF